MQDCRLRYVFAPYWKPGLFTETNTLNEGGTEKYLDQPTRCNSLEKTHQKLFLIGKMM